MGGSAAMTTIPCYYSITVITLKTTKFAIRTMFMLATLTGNQNR